MDYCPYLAEPEKFMQPLQCDCTAFLIVFHMGWRLLFPKPSWLTAYLLEFSLLEMDGTIQFIY
jgi:hypothetical protein